MLSLTLELEQQQRLENDVAAFENQIDQETDLYHVGRFDGLSGCEPTHIERHSYWAGYETGLRQYWASKKGIQLETEF